MKICIITYSRTKNYGGILQAYGLYRYLELQKHEVSFIDYIPKRCNINNKKIFISEITSKSRIWGKSKLTRWLFSILRYPKIKEAYVPFIEFLNKKALFTKPYYNIDDIYNDIPKADIFITGSDQVWNSQFNDNQEIDLPFYLPFISKQRKISYASSFGKDFIEDSNKEMVKNLIGQYNAVSVRELSGQRLLLDLGISSTVVVDPTILCPYEEWESLTSQKLDSDYILFYQVLFNKSVYDLAEKVANHYRKKLITISLESKDKRYISGELIIAPSIENWLSYIKYADYIITDSFHACVFSILYRKQFVVNSGTRKTMSTRITNLLESLELSSRENNSFDINIICDVMNAGINWDMCYSKLSILREKSITWLSQAIKPE